MGFMKWIRAALARVGGFFAGSRGDDDLREELRAHIDMATAENIRRGMDPDAARRQALLESGGLTQAAEAVRDRRGLPWVDGIVSDMKYAVRSLRHSRAFAAVVIVTLGLGIGANTAIFSVVRAVLLKPLPHKDGDRLVYLRQSMDGPGGENLNFSVPEINDFRGGVKSLGGIAEYSTWSITMRTDREAERVSVGLHPVQQLPEETLVFLLGNPLLQDRQDVRVRLGPGSRAARSAGVAGPGNLRLRSPTASRSATSSPVPPRPPGRSSTTARASAATSPTWPSRSAGA